MAVPRDARAEDLRQLELLCVMAQIGLVLFDADSPEDPQWNLRVRPQLGQPDMACLNEKLALLREELYS